MEMIHEKVITADLLFHVTFSLLARFYYHESEGLQGKALFSSLV